jgi:hypothetical protein
MRLALTTAFFAAASADPLLAERAELAASLPTVPLSESVMEKRAAAAAPAGFKPLHPDNANATATGTRILIMGDSWGTLSPATEYFEKELKEHNCPLGGFTNIAVGGSTAREWAEDAKLKEAAEQAPKHDHVWITLMGNDARAEMPACAAKGKTAEQCGDELMVRAGSRSLLLLLLLLLTVPTLPTLLTRLPSTANRCRRWRAWVRLWTTSTRRTPRRRS